MGWLEKMACDHPRGRWATVTYDYANGEQDKSIICTICGKVILPSEHFDEMKDILTTKGATHD